MANTLRKSIGVGSCEVILDPSSSLFYTEFNLDALLHIQDDSVYLDIKGHNYIADNIFCKYLPLTMQNIPKKNNSDSTPITDDDLDRINGKAYHLYSKMRLSIPCIDDLFLDYCKSPLEAEFYTVKNIETVISNLNYINIGIDLYNDLTMCCSKNKLSIWSMYLDLASKGKVKHDESIKELIDKLQSKLFSISVKR